jgi:hypothetical protein
LGLKLCVANSDRTVFQHPAESQSIVHAARSDTRSRKQLILKLGGCRDQIKRVRDNRAIAFDVSQEPQQPARSFIADRAKTYARPINGVISQRCNVGGRIIRAISMMFEPGPLWSH